MALGQMRRHSNRFEIPKLQITSMMDMFTIVLIFLLFCFSNKPTNLHLGEELKLPESIAEHNYRENIKMVLSQKTLELEDKIIATVKGDKIIGLEPTNLKGSILYQELKSYKEIEDELRPDGGPEGQILFFCDKRLPFTTINTIIKTAAMAGYPNVQLAVLKK